VKNEARLRAERDQSTICGKRLRKGREKLSEEEREQLRSILLQEPELLMAYVLKEAFRDWFFNQSRLK
jgi:ABC-type uncharacterized transport system YnjBCD ATPase subunit